MIKSAFELDQRTMGNLLRECSGKTILKRFLPIKNGGDFAFNSENNFDFLYISLRFFECVHFLIKILAIANWTHSYSFQDLSRKFKMDDFLPMIFLLIEEKGTREIWREKGPFENCKSVVTNLRTVDCNLRPKSNYAIKNKWVHVSIKSIYKFRCSFLKLTLASQDSIYYFFILTLLTSLHPCYWIVIDIIKYHMNFLC